MITRKDKFNLDRLFDNKGFNTTILNGKYGFVIDTCFTIDHGNESMVFACDEKGEITDWTDLDCKRGFSTNEMESIHKQMVQKWTDKLERGDMTDKIEFVSYDGSFPNLCRGTLVIKVNGKEYNCGECLMSGGSAFFDNNGGDHIEEGEWSIDKDYLPKEIEHLYEEIADVVNANVPYGCCGGCL
jgi:hypothetical protein